MTVVSNLGMYKGEYGYLKMLEDILIFGKDRGDRTGTGTRSVFSSQLTFDLEDGFPAMTTKKLFFNGVAGELLWFLSGSNSLKDLRRFTYGEDKGQHTIWSDDYEKFGRGDKGGRIYGQQWRAAAGEHSDFGMVYVDQLKEILDIASSNPESRRLLVNSWNASEVVSNQMALPPCHFAFQFYIEDGKLNCKWNQRSCDVFLGVPFNIASYALLTHLYATWLNLKVGTLIGDLTNVHIYHNHFVQVEDQISRTPYTPPRLLVPNYISLDNISNYTADDFKLVNYNHHPTIKAAQSS